MYSVVFKKGELFITGRLVTQTLSEKWTVHRRGQRFPLWSEQSSFITENTLVFSKFCIAGKRKGRDKCKQQSCWDSSGPSVRQVWQKNPNLGFSPGCGAAQWHTSSYPGKLTWHFPGCFILLCAHTWSWAGWQVPAWEPHMVSAEVSLNWALPLAHLNTFKIKVKEQKF